MDAVTQADPTRIRSFYLQSIIEIISRLFRYSLPFCPADFHSVLPTLPIQLILGYPCRILSRFLFDSRGICGRITIFTRRRKLFFLHVVNMKKKERIHQFFLDNRHLRIKKIDLVPKIQRGFQRILYRASSLFPLQKKINE